MSCFCGLFRKSKTYFYNEAFAIISRSAKASQTFKAIIDAEILAGASHLRCPHNSEYSMLAPFRVWVSYLS